MRITMVQMFFSRFKEVFHRFVLSVQENGHSLLADLHLLLPDQDVARLHLASHWSDLWRSGNIHAILHLRVLVRYSLQGSTF